MASPLIHRLPRELVHNLGRYAGIFLLIAVSIGFVSGFLVAASSIERMIGAVADTYHVEDGQFTTAFRASDEALAAVEDLGVTVEENFSHDEDLRWTLPEGAESDAADSGTVRVFENRTTFNQAAYAEGTAPARADEIALDRVFCAHAGLTVGDAVDAAGSTFTLSGICTLSDYSALFEDNGDFVFNALTFSIAQVTPEAFDDMPGTPTYTYAYFTDSPLTDAQAADLLEDIAQTLADHDTAVLSLMTAQANNAISYAGDDVQGDQLMWKVMLFLLVVIMAFVFVVLTGANIEAESAIIGTLLASGYRKRELLCHYLALPALVGVAAAAVGNIAGYGWLSAPMRDLYYNSYSLPPYEAVFNPEVFVLTTVVPVVLLVGITFAGLLRKLRCTPLEFLRHETTRKSRRRGVALPERWPFAVRFRLRVFLCSLSNYVTLFLGLVFASLLLVFGLCLMPVIEHYAENLQSDLVAEHQYVLKVPVEIEADDAAADQAEKFAATTLETARALGDSSEEVTVYGVTEGSAYWKDLDVSDGRIVAGRGLAEKCAIALGEPVAFEDKLDDETYEFTVDGTYGSASNTNLYMSLETFNRLFGKSADYFNGYVSDEALALDDLYVVSDLTPDSMDKIVSQMRNSMGSMTYLLTTLAAIVYVVLIFLLTKTVIDRNARAIAYLKVFGYRPAEVNRLYLRSITTTVIVSVIACLPLVVGAIALLVKVVFMEYAGNFEIVIPPAQLALTVFVGIACYGVVAVAHMARIKRVPMALALKAQE
ncbi:FtsX-like permease family protein [uncultured Adlercreutzia sp.]|uniref:ABC transporter permease n=2 Tax=uncultured Adlercreutzia sp. TaxID=875803 RepID=UPI0025DCB1F6|nr:FtsX-like permease family protein [uncultured Adlercreutzia sp.]